MIGYAACSTTRPADVRPSADFLLTLTRSWDRQGQPEGPVRWGRAPVAQGIEHLSPKEVAQVRILPGAPCDVSRHAHRSEPTSGFGSCAFGGWLDAAWLVVPGGVE